MECLSCWTSKSGGLKIKPIITYIYVLCLPVALCDCVHGWRQCQLGIREVAHTTNPIFSTTRTNPSPDTLLAVMQPTLLRGTKNGMRQVFQDHLWLFGNQSL